MQINAVLVKEFFSQSRNITGYWLRTASIALVFFIWYINHADDPNDGQGALKAVTFIAAIYFGLFAGISSSHAIALELRNNTLGLLFLTRLRSFEILLGKILPHGIQCFICLIAIIPILSLTLINGGVTLTDLLRCLIIICFSIYIGLLTGIYWAVGRPKHNNSKEKNTFFLIFPFLTFLLWLPCNYAIGNEFHLFGYAQTLFILFAITFNMFTFSYKRFLSIWNREFKSELSQTSQIKRLLAKPLESKINKTLKTEEIRLSYRRLPNIKDNENPHQILISFLHPKFFFNQGLIYFGLFLVILYSCLSLFSDTHPNRHPNLNFACFFLVIMELAVRFNVAIETPHQMLSDRKSRMMELLLISPLSVLSIVAGIRSFLKLRLHHRFVLLGIGYVWVAGVFFALYIRDGYIYSDKLIVCLCLSIMTFFVFYIKFFSIPVRSTIKHYSFLFIGYLSIPVSLSFIMINFIFIFSNSDGGRNTFHFFIYSGFLMCSFLCFFRGLKTEYLRFQTKRFLLLIFIFILVFGIICYNVLSIIYSGKFGEITSCFNFFTGAILLFFWGFRYELQQWQIKRFLIPSAVYFIFLSVFFMIMYDPVFNYILNSILLCLCFFIGTYYLSYYELSAMQYYGIWLATGKHSHWFISVKLFSASFLFPIVTFIAASLIIQVCFIIFYDSFFMDNMMVHLAGSFLLWHYFRSAYSRFANNFAHLRLCQLRSLLD